MQMKPATQGGDASVLHAPHSALRWALVLLPLAFLWFRLIDNLQLEWTTNPQYGYGLLVPFLCLGLLVRRWHAAHGKGLRDDQAAGLQTKERHDYETTGQQDRGSAVSSPVVRSPVDRGLRSVVSSPWSVVLFFAVLAFLYLPTRLLEAAVPVWNPIQWLLGIEAVGLTLCVIGLGRGRGWLRQLAFPICFFLVAIPWPTLVEQPIIQHLTRASAAIVIELLGWLGVPALAHGNVIEVSTGLVGIDEACSGIRSFQSSLMISLFFGEFYRLSPGRRWLLIPLGFAFSFAFNVGRMLLLTLIAAKKGVAAISQYHDEAGVTIAILCTLALWGIAALMRHRSAADNKTTGQQDDGVTESQTTEAGGQKSEDRLKPQGGNAASSSPVVRDPVVGSPSQVVRGPSSTVGNLGLSLIVWLMVSEAGVQAWYHIREAHLKPGPAWTLTFPRDNPTLKDLPMDATTRNLLRFDEAKQAAWTEPDGTQWQAFYFNWLPGRVAGYLAKRHTPEICLTAAGLKLLSGPKLTMMNVHGVDLPIRSYVFQTPEGVVQVFHCRWEAGATEDDYVTHESARYNLIRAIWNGRGDKGQKVLEFVISGMDDPAQAKQALERELNKLIVVKR
jgi:exosortase